MRTDLTRHARTRMQKRSIPPFVLDPLDRCGSSVRCGGAESLFFDKAARRRLQDYLGGRRALRAVDAWLGVYAVLADDGRFVTVAHRQRRLKRP